MCWCAFSESEIFFIVFVFLPVYVIFLLWKYFFRGSSGCAKKRRRESFTSTQMAVIPMFFWSEGLFFQKIIFFVQKKKSKWGSAAWNQSQLGGPASVRGSPRGGRWSPPSCCWSQYFFFSRTLMPKVKVRKQPQSHKQYNVFQLLSYPAEQFTMSKPQNPDFRSSTDFEWLESWNVRSGISMSCVYVDRLHILTDKFIYSWENKWSRYLISCSRNSRAPSELRKCWSFWNTISQLFLSFTNKMAQITLLYLGSAKVISIFR